MSRFLDPETGARPTPEPSLPLFAALPEVEKVSEVQPSLNRAAMHTKVSRHDGSNDAAIGRKHIAAQSQGEQAFARRSDPIHSREASRSVVNLGRTRDGIIDILKLKGPLTDEQIWAAYSAWYDRGRTVPRVSPSGLRSRRAELVRMGFVCEGGTGKTASGRACSIWKLSGEYAAGVSQ